MCVCMHTKSLQSCPTLCDSMDCSPPGSSIHGILQARIPEWVAIPSSRGSSRSKDWIHVSYALWCLSLLPGDTSLPCAYWMNTNVLIKPWWRSTLQSSLKICTKLEGGEKEGRTLQVCQKKKHVTVKGVFRETAFLLKSPQMKSALISPPLTWVFWEVKGQ